MKKSNKSHALNSADKAKPLKKSAKKPTQKMESLNAKDPSPLPLPEHPSSQAPLSQSALGDSAPSQEAFDEAFAGASDPSVPSGKVPSGKLSEGKLSEGKLSEGKLPEKSSNGHKAPQAFASDLTAHNQAVAETFSPAQISGQTIQQKTGKNPDPNSKAKAISNTESSPHRDSATGSIEPSLPMNTAGQSMTSHPSLGNGDFFNPDFSAISSVRSSQFLTQPSPPAVSNDRVAIFIDGSNLFYAASHLSIEVDYRRLLTTLVRGRRLLRAYFYTGVDPQNEKQRGFLLWLNRHGHRVVSKELAHLPDGSRKANLHVEMAVDMMRIAEYCSTLTLLGGDGNLAYAIEVLSRRGNFIEVVSLQSMTSDSLIDLADTYIDLADLREQIKR